MILSCHNKIKYKRIKYQVYQVYQSLNSFILNTIWNILIKYKDLICLFCQDEMFENIVYNSYYQWVPLYLTFLAFFFYLPRYIWLKMEGGLMKLFRKGTTAR